MRYFCGTSNISDTSDASNTAHSSDESKTSATVTRLSSYLYRDTDRNIKVRIENTKLPSERFQLG